MRQTASRARDRAARLLQALSALVFMALRALTAIVFARPGAAAPACAFAPPGPPAVPAAWVPEVVPPPGGDPEDYDPEYDYGAPVPLCAGVEEGWFSDAAFLGDSLT